MNAQETVLHIVNWLDNYLEQSGQKGFVVGVSGGIDSALTSTLCAKTERPVIALSMPIYQKVSQETLADQHLAWLDANFENVTTHSVELTPVFQSMESHLPAEIQDDLTMANSRSRLRMITLYAFAGHHRMLVAGTGNKVEDFGVGFFTKYGDGGVDLSPIADLMKSEVYELAEHLNVIEGIQKAAPTDGLWEDDRTDESQLGASYDDLEWAMDFIASGENRNSLSGEQKNILAVYEKFHLSNKHKMEPLPVCQIPEHLREG